MWSYTYTTPSASQKLARQQALYDVILCVYIILLSLICFLGLFDTWPLKNTSLVRWMKRVGWRLASPIAVRYPGFRCWADLGLVVAWAGAMMALAVWRTGDDYLHLTKAFGAVAMANLPIHFALSVDSKLLAYISHYPVEYEQRRNFLHRWLGRIIEMLLGIHGCLYLKFFWDTNRMTTRFLEFDVMCGFIGLLVISTLSISANQYFRQRIYRVFYLLHILLSAAILPLLYIHIPYSIRKHIILGFCVLIILLTNARRFFYRIPARGVVRRISPDLLSLTLTLQKDPSRTPITPGSHAIIQNLKVSKFRKNTFSIVSVDRRQIQLVCRVHKGFTRELAEYAEGESIVELAVQISSGPSCYFPDLGRFDNVVFIAGGVGATFAVSWVRELKDRCRFVWAVKSLDETRWALEEEVVRDVMEVYVTGQKEMEDEGTEMMEGLLSKEQGDEVEGLEKERIFQGRPNIGRILGEVVGEGRKTAVLVCGPVGMNMVTRRVVAKLGARGESVWLHVEEFGY
ncbi:hypothetical protein BZA77DRAFT_95335 [Pyronema omphalodes]|nr:hypothetical protein BZA77DRAFT_95335 [Pyronema omphalodes]